MIAILLLAKGTGPRALHGHKIASRRTLIVGTPFYIDEPRFSSLTTLYGRPTNI